MNLIMESWRSFTNSTITEQEVEIVEAAYAELMESMLNEGLLSAGAALWNATKEKLQQFSDWTESQVQALAKKLGQGLINFLNLLKQKGVLKKYKARKEVNAIKLLLTKKHISLATTIFVAIAKLTGGYAVELVTKSKEIIETISDVLAAIVSGDIKEVIAILFGGEAPDVIELIKKFVEYSKDAKSFAGKAGAWDVFGGLAENLQGVYDEIN
jgi:hypothetical protein